MKTIFKVLVISLALCLMLGSCNLFNKAKQEAQRVTEFTVMFAEVLESPTVENAQQLIHPDSSLTAESVIDKIKSNEKLAILSEVESEEDIQIGDISEPKIKLNDPELGGNVYEIECEIVVKGTAITLTLEMLSSDKGFGLLDFDVK